MTAKKWNVGPMLNAYPDSVGGRLADVVALLQREELRDAFRSVSRYTHNGHTDGQTEKQEKRKALEEQIQAVEEELKTAAGPGAIMRRVRLKKQLQELRDRLAQIS